METSVSSGKKRIYTAIDLKMVIIASVVYFVNYLTRYDFSAAILEMAETFGGDAKTALGLALTLTSVSYGAGQIITGIIGDRLPPRYMVAAALLGTSLCNLTVGIATDINLIVAVWFVNGFCQAAIWPSLMRQMIHDMTEEGFKHGVVYVSAACSFSTVVIYLALIPFSIAVSTWRLAFIISATVGILVSVLWFFSVKTLKREKNIKVVANKTENGGNVKKSSAFAMLLAAGAPLIYFVIACQGVLRDGVADWMPNLVNDTFNLGNMASIMSSAVLPIFAVVCVFIAGKLYEKIGNEVKSSLILWGVGTGALLLLFFVFDFSPVVSVCLLAVLSGCIHGINHILTARIPRHFASANLVSTATGVFNSATYLGAAISGIGFAVLPDIIGWNFTVLVWAGVGIFGIVGSVLLYKRWTGFIKENP